VDRESEQTQLFWLRSAGKKGTWDEESKVYAKRMAAAICSTLADSRGVEVQRDWLTKRIRRYAFKHAKVLVEEAPDTPVGKALVAGLLSFCVNNPSWAAKYSKIADESWKGDRWTEDWLIHVFKELTFGPKISIYPHRWDAIRRPLERHFGLNLPDLSSDLKDWNADKIGTKEIQRILRYALLFDLGASGPNGDGVDGIYGKKTKAAVSVVQELCGLEVDGWVGEETIVVLKGAREAWDGLSDEHQESILGLGKLNTLTAALQPGVDSLIANQR